jgi:hypothetical protein
MSGSATHRNRDTRRRLAAYAHSVAEAVGKLEGQVNTNSIARYELTLAHNAMWEFATTASSRGPRAAEKHLSRVLVMLPLDQREPLSQIVQGLLVCLSQLTAESRLSLIADWDEVFDGWPSSTFRERRHATAACASGAAKPALQTKTQLKTEMGALDAWERWTAPDSLGDEIDLACSVMQRLSIGLERWPSYPASANASGTPWNVENEYHVQSLLWLVLAPLLPGLRFEETLPSIGRTHPRVDLALPRLQLAVEVKYIRNKLDFARVTNELAADSSLYISNDEHGYSRMLFFVWDDTRSTERHGQFVEGVKTFRGVIDGFVISRPARMD